ncbi:MAG: DUF11 domain-containing protein [Xanthomonadales bacterium]|nr:DUF11 domain-containing protein [Xanthomonadales bacterium]
MRRMRVENHTTGMRGATAVKSRLSGTTGKQLLRRALFAVWALPLVLLAGITDASANVCLTDTSQANFQIGMPTSVSLTSGGEVTLASSAVVDQQNTSISVNGFAFTTSAWFGQTFKAGVSGQLSKLDVYLFCSGCTGTTPNVIVTIRATEVAANGTNVPAGNDLATATIPGFNNGAGAYFTANFDTPVSITAGTVYSFTVHASANPSLGTYAYVVSADNPYANGDRVNSTSTGLFWDVRTWDVGFRIYVGSGYVSAGNLASSAKDSIPAAGETPAWSTLSWNGVTPANTTLKFQVAGANMSSGPWTYVGPDGSAGTFFTTSGATLSQFNGSRYIKYKALLATTNTPTTPTLNDVTVCYSNAATTADLQITKTDGVTTATPGGVVTYSIVASNAGPSAVNGALVTDTYEAVLNCNWTCAGSAGGSCLAPSGSGNISNTVNLPVGGIATYTASCSIDPAAIGSLSNTASISSALVDPVPGNNNATDTDTLAPSANLGITKTDGVTAVTPGGTVTYTIAASNAGPSAVNGATVTDTLPAALTCNWTCLGTGGASCPSSGSGSINSSVNLTSGGSTTFTASCTVAGNATGSLSNTATISSTVADSVPGNNSATDTDTLAVTANLGITKTDGVTAVTPGGNVTYSIVASNAGPTLVNGATVTDTFPAALTCAWTCAGAAGGTCPASGTGNINSSVNLPVGGSTTFTASCAVAANATGSISNTASVTSTVTDPVPGNNSATDTDSVTASADLAITKTNGVTTSTPGATTSYTIVASNAGPSAVTGATVTDTLPTALSCTWTCAGAVGGTCPASGTGNIATSVNLPVGGTATFSASCTIAANATGSLSNTATISSTVADSVPGNNSATDTDTLAVTANLGITNTDGVAVAAPGGAVTYTIVASNAGPTLVNGATVKDTFPPMLSCSWTCTASAGGSCPASGSGQINHAVSLPVNGSATYIANCTIAQGASGSIDNTASVTGSMADPVPGNNTATDVTVLQADAIFVSNFE